MANPNHAMAPSPRQTFNGQGVLRIPGRKLKIATWNVKTLHRAGKLTNAEQEMKRMGWDILGMSEVRWTGEGSTHTEDGSQFFYSGGDIARHGVGILVTTTITQHVKGFFPVSDRVLLLKLKGAPFDINLIQIYAPTAESSDEEIEDFYNDIEKTKRSIKGHDINIFLGDWNAKVGSDRVEHTIGPFGLGNRNERGTRFIQFCQENNLIVTNTWFKLPKRRLYTWKSPQDTQDNTVRNQIDYIAINSRFKNSVLNAKTYPGCDINSDHNPVVITMQVKLKKIQKPKTTNKISWNTTNRTQLEQYEKHVEVQLESKSKCEQRDGIEGNIETMWTNLKNVITETAEIKIGKTNRKQKNQWMTQEILELMNERRKNKNNKTLYKELNKKIDKLIVNAKEKWLLERCKEVEDLQTKHKDRELHAKIKEVAGIWKPRQLALVTNENNEIVADTDQQKQIWERYIGELFKDDRSVVPPSVENNESLPILTYEVERAIAEAKNNKSPGEDAVTAEHFKYLGENSIKKLTLLFNKVYETGILPKDWLTSTYIALPKKNKARKCEDHRTICLMSHAAKIFMRIIFNRIRNKCEEYLSRSQYGFRKGTGTREATMGLTLIAERYLEVRKKLYVCFVDYKKAFDRIKHEHLIEILKNIGLDGDDISIIRNMYWNHQGCVRTENGNTNYVKIERGVRQGCVLSPLLFNVYAEHIIKSSLHERPEGAKINGITINNIRYADDTVVLAENEEQLQTLMNTLAEESANMGLEINPEKTKTMIFSREHQAQYNTNIAVGGIILQNVQKYTYLGREVNSQADHSKEIRRRIEIARNGFVNMKKVLCHPKISLVIRLRTLKCYVWSLLLYNCETWTLKQDDIQKLKSFEMWTYRRMLRISWITRTSNETVLERMNTRPQLVQTVKIRKTAYLGHIMRHKEFEQLQLIIEGKIDGRRGVGRKKKSWLRNIKEWTKTAGNQLIHQAHDREEYARLTANLNRDGT